MTLPSWSVGAAKPQPLGGAVVDEQHVDGVVADREHRDLVDRLEGHHLAGPARIMGNRLDWRNVHVAVIVAHDVVLPSGGVRSWYHTTP
jgi:hypothetical protein